MAITEQQAKFFSDSDNGILDKSISSGITELEYGEEPTNPTGVTEESSLEVEDTVSKWNDTKRESIQELPIELSQEDKDKLIKSFTRFVNGKIEIIENTSSYTYSQLRSNSIYIMCEKDSWMNDARMTFLRRAMYRNTARTTGGSSICFYGYSDGGDDANKAAKKRNNKGSPKTYKIAVQFYPDDSIRNSNGKTNLDLYTELSDKKLYKPSINRDYVKVTCSCNAFYFYNSHSCSYYGCKFGKPPKDYKAITERGLNLNNKTGGSHVTSVGQTYGPSVCKHIVNFIEDYLLNMHLVIKPEAFTNMGHIYIKDAKEISKETIDELDNQIREFKLRVVAIKTEDDYGIFMEEFNKKYNLDW